MIAKNATSALSQHDGALCKWQMLLFKGRPCWRLSWQLGKISVVNGPQTASGRKNQDFLIQMFPSREAA
jgi:hypothetical protein